MRRRLPGWRIGELAKQASLANCTEDVAGKASKAMVSAMWRNFRLGSVQDDVGIELPV